MFDRFTSALMFDRAGRPRPA